LISINVSFLAAQVEVPQKSPGATVSQEIGLATVTIEYSRPQARGREIFGGLVPYRKIWRTGANSPVKLTTTHTIKFGDSELQAGSYALYTIPENKKWTILIGEDPSISAWDFDQSTAVARFTVPTKLLVNPVETFTIEFTNLSVGKARLEMKWEKTQVGFQVEHDYDQIVVDNITSELSNNRKYFVAARYYYETDRDLEKALEWINKSLETDDVFYISHWKAKIQAKMGDCEGAIKTAEESLEAAKKAENEGYVKQNEELIADCK
jgi:hypothetical protein